MGRSASSRRPAARSIARAAASASSASTDPVAQAHDPSRLGRRRRLAIAGIKAAHSATFFGLLASLLVFAQRGVAGRSDRLAALTGATVAAEALVFLGNGRRCPLTDVVESLGAT